MSGQRGGLPSPRPLASPLAQVGAGGSEAPQVLRPLSRRRTPRRGLREAPSPSAGSPSSGSVCAPRPKYRAGLRWAGGSAPAATGSGARAHPAPAHLSGCAAGPGRDASAGHGGWAGSRRRSCRRRLPGSGESPPGAAGPASAHVTRGRPRHRPCPGSRLLRAARPGAATGRGPRRAEGPLPEPRGDGGVPPRGPPSDGPEGCGASRAPAPAPLRRPAAPPAARAPAHPAPALALPRAPRSPAGPPLGPQRRWAATADGCGSPARGVRPAREG